jgi:hypothetical protein
MLGEADGAAGPAAPPVHAFVGDDLDEGMSWHDWCRKYSRSVILSQELRQELLRRVTWRTFVRQIAEMQAAIFKLPRTLEDEK